MRLNIISNNVTEARLCLLEYLLGNNFIPNKILYYSKGIFLEPFFKKINNECDNCIIPNNCVLLIDNLISDMSDKIKSNIDESNNLVIFSATKIEIKLTQKVDFIYLNPIFSLKNNFFDYYQNIIKKYQTFWNDKYYFLNQKINLINCQENINDIQDEIEELDYNFDNQNEIINQDKNNDDWIFFF
jgi:hypothetical protein